MLTTGDTLSFILRRPRDQDDGKERSLEEDIKDKLIYINQVCVGKLCPCIKIKIILVHHNVYTAYSWHRRIFSLSSL